MRRTTCRVRSRFEVPVEPEGDERASQDPEGERREMGRLRWIDPHVFVGEDRQKRRKLDRSLLRNQPNRDSGIGPNRRNHVDHRQNHADDAERSAQPAPRAARAGPYPGDWHSEKRQDRHQKAGRSWAVPAMPFRVQASDQICCGDERQDDARPRGMTIVEKQPR